MPLNGVTKNLVMLKRHPFAIAAGGAILTLVATVIAFSFIGAEKQIERRIERLYPLDDPCFHQELGVLLGPHFVAGTRYGY